MNQIFYKPGDLITILSALTSIVSGKWFTSCKADRIVTSLRAEPSKVTEKIILASMSLFCKY